jgi:predicted O-methyltransferase YrrM
VILHKGWFSDTLPLFLDEYSESVRFLHVDCDLYSSTRTIFSALADRLVPGTVIVFDEFFNYPGWQECEYKAFMEFVSTGRRFEYLAYNCRSEQVAVRLL